MDSFVQDLRYGIRTLIKNPGLTAVIVLSLALGIGANISVFSFVNAFLLRPLPVKDPDQLVALYSGDSDHPYGGISYLNFLEYRQQNDVFSDMIAFWRMAPVNLSSDGRTERVWGSVVSGNYFSLLGVKTALGRTFLPEEDRTPGSHPVAVLSHDLWQRHFGSDPSLIGKAIKLNGHSFTVVGVAPKNFKGTTVGLSSDIWIPLMMQAQVMPAWDLLNNRGIHLLFVVARLKPGVTLDQARASMNVLALRVEQAHPSQSSRWTATLVPISKVDPEFDRSLFSVAGLLMALVGLVLLLSCTNVATLQLARASVRQRELSIRIAIGASRLRLIRQLLTESALLSLLGGAVGLILAFWTTDLLSVFKLPYFVPISLDLKLEARVLTFALVLSVLAGILFGLAAALHSSRLGYTNPLRGEPVKTSLKPWKLGLHSLLVIAQTSISVVLLVVAGLFVRSFRNAQATNPGFNPNNVLAMSFDPKLDGYSDAQSTIFYRQLVERVSALAGAQSVSLARMAPLDLMRLWSEVAAEGQLRRAEGSNLMVSTNSVTPRYFETLGIPLLFGRDFSEHDSNEAPRVAIVNEAMAHHLWPGQDPVGKRILCGDNRLEVVGVVKNGMYENWGKEVRPYMFTPLAQNDEAMDFPLTLLLRTTRDAKDMVVTVRSQVVSLDGNLAFDIKSMTEQIHRTLSLPRMGALLTGMFGSLGLVLAVVGIYGLISYTATRSTHEIGVRMALGAELRDVLKLMLTQGIVLTVTGLIIGLAASLSVTRLLSNLLFGVTTNDSVTFVFVPAFLIAAALLASYVPARRAAKVDPMVALRYE
jgi:macrolide transport system ATP-binding/permease protein